MYLAEALSPEDYVRHIQMEKQQQQWLAGHDERLDKFRQKMIRRQKQVLCLAWISAWFVRNGSTCCLKRRISAWIGMLCVWFVTSTQAGVTKCCNYMRSFVRCLVCVHHMLH